MEQPHEEREFEQLLELARANDRRALSALLAQSNLALLRLVRLRMHPLLEQRLEPADIVQEALFEATLRFEEWSKDARIPFRVWLRLITLQALATAQRRHLGTQKRDLGREDAGRDRPSVSSQRLMDYLEASQTSPTQAVQRDQVRSAVQQALEGLEEMDREIIVLRQFEELSNEEAAHELGIDPSSASKRFVRALQRLRPALRRFELPEKA